MRFLSLLAPPLFIAAAAPAQALHNSGATITVTAGATLSVLGDLTNSATATIANSGMLNVSGNATNDGAVLQPAGATLTLAGSSAQTISGANPLAAGNVVVNNPAGIILATPLQVAGAMSFTAGLVTATSPNAPVIFTATGSVSGTPTDGSHVLGYAQKQGTGAFTFPVGNAAKYQPVAVNLSANSAGLTARYHAADAGAAPYGTGGAAPTPLVAYNALEYWDLAPAGTASGQVTIFFDGYGNTGIGNTADLRVAHKTGGQYLNEDGAATGTPGSGSVTSAAISSWSPFTLGSVSAGSPLAASPLGFDLVSFTAYAAGAANRLDWAIAGKSAGPTFTIERSATGSDFTAIGSVVETADGAGGYSFYDRTPVVPAGYYRLKRTDISGAASYSSTAIVRRAGSGAGGVTIAPVPADHNLSISVSGAAMTGGEAVILDMLGREVCRFVVQERQVIDVRSWPAGVYTLHLPHTAVMRIVRK